ncbi:hypothetical protein SAMN04487944_1021, partial [Gracilibacillus ureilyticus]
FTRLKRETSVGSSLKQVKRSSDPQKNILKRELTRWEKTLTNMRALYRPYSLEEPWNPLLYKQQVNCYRKYVSLVLKEPEYQNKDNQQFILQEMRYFIDSHNTNFWLKLSHQEITSVQKKFMLILSEFKRLHASQA